ncbi:hypothetical protein [Bacillus nakamurai]|uniref:hypothetical protein n=1 Tax=Bacillus nakamurai TaxID=1793963 RepID=UPI0020C2CC58|nr:hypothetical protein [Bacillus nakamurai]MCP6682950.1 hypothetical protein [Bacillus nakamurai]
MAKLDGVKTLDMVNGEITKVAYGGAEYERVEGRAKESGSVGDLVLNERIHCDLTVGAFYEIVIDEDYGCETVRDDVGDGHSSALYNSGSVLFRKVSASTDPSLEERISSAESELETLKSDVASLKGEVGYKRIDADEAKVGDFVKFDDPRSFLPDKEYYEIEEFDCGDPIITDDDGDSYDTYGTSFKVYRKVSAASVEAEPQPERLKVGDYAKVVDANQLCMASFRDGEIVEIIPSPHGVDDEDFRVASLSRSATGYTKKTPKYVIRATDEEVAEAKDAAARAKFKEGDKVRLLSGGAGWPLSGFHNGEFYEVADANFDHPRGKLIKIVSDRGRIGFATPDQLEILSEEEVAEIKRKQAEEAKWAKIGRKVGEYKKGDVVSYDDPAWFKNSGIGEVVGLSAGDPRVRAVDSGGDKPAYYLDPVKLRLITPVEARFDR